jgi:hypothetical protein
LFNTGAGLNFISLFDRCLDIPLAWFKGAPLCWLSHTGIHRPDFYEPEDTRFLRTFFGGLLTTCGLTAAGAPGSDSYGPYGLHGRATALPTEEVAVWNEWCGDEMEMGVSGKVREASVFGENVLMKRRITANLGKNTFLLEDSITNEGYSMTPFMILYHINLGFPVVSQGSELLVATDEATPRDKEARAGVDTWNTFESPQPAYDEQVFFLDLPPDGDGVVDTASVNRDFNNGKGIGVHISWKKEELPLFTEWKQVGEGTYTVGLEPANCLPLGRAAEQRDGRLQFLEPGDTRRVAIRFEVLEDSDSINQLQSKLRDLKDK